MNPRQKQKNSQLSSNYLQILAGLKAKIRSARQRAILKVNTELLLIYWEVGNTILEQQKEEGWGAKIIDSLANDLRIEFPDMTGFSVRNLKYMRAFAEAYPDFLQFVQPSAAQLHSDSKIPIEQPIVAQIPWTHHTIILDKAKSLKERLFYIEKTLENGWSKTILSMQIGSGLFNRQGNAITNFTYTLPAIQSDLANETLKNPYILDFLSYSEEMKEREFEKALIQHLKKFMLELGRGFAYVGNQKNINIEGDDFFLDLLFYNYNLHCFVIFELKVGDFKPEFAGKLNFYVNTVNEQLKGPNDRNTIGVLLCKTPNTTVIEYSLKGINSPIGVADYELAKALPKEFKGAIPSIAELEAEIEKEYEELKSPSQKRFENLRERLSHVKGNEIKQTATTEILFDLIDLSLIPLFKNIIERFKDFSDWFVTQSHFWQAKGETINELNQLAEKWKNEELLRSNFELKFNYRFNGLIKAGINSFDISNEFQFKMETYWYGFVLINYNENQPIIKKLYHEQLSAEEIGKISDSLYDDILNEIERKLERIRTLD